MLRWALIFFLISLVSGYLGFFRVSAATGGIAKLLFGLFLAVAVVVVIFALAIGQAIF